MKADRFTYYDALRPEESSRLLTLREVCELFDLDHRVVYAAARTGRLHALQRDGKGRKYYAEWEVREVLRFLYRPLDSAAA
jgi:Helix-turn-helix domain